MVSLRVATDRRALLICAVLTLTGCPTPEDKECQAEQKCNQLGAQTVSQCSTTADSCQSQLRNGNSDCADLADAIDAYDNCQAAQTCEDRQSTNASGGPCSNEFDNLIGTAYTAIVIDHCPSCGSAYVDAGS